MYGGRFALQNRLGQPYTWKEIYRFCFVLLCKVEGNFQVPALGEGRGLYLEGRFNGGFLRYEFGGLLFGEAYTWRVLFSEFYGNCSSVSTCKLGHVWLKIKFCQVFSCVNLIIIQTNFSPKVSPVTVNASIIQLK